MCSDSAQLKFMKEIFHPEGNDMNLTGVIQGEFNFVINAYSIMVKYLHHHNDIFRLKLKYLISKHNAPMNYTECSTFTLKKGSMATKTQVWKILKKKDTEITFKPGYMEE